MVNGFDDECTEFFLLSFMMMIFFPERFTTIREMFTDDDYKVLVL